jgi:uncharacterized flavoprotein (TIGR03862 family)
MSKSATVVGAGPAGLMAAEVLATAGISVTIIDHMPSPARKFLLAGRGGLNLTHSQPLESFLAHYGNARAFLEPMIYAFPPASVIAWCESLGLETFVGSSGRVFPKTMKASPLLRAWLRKLESLGVQLNAKTEWQGFDGTPTILAMGGASWPHLGSNAAWLPLLRNAGIKVNDLVASNGRIIVPWTDHFASRFAGTPLKNVKLSYGSHIARGEMMITAQGLEGGAIYELSRPMRDAPGKPLLVDLKPTLTGEAIAKRLAQPRGKMSQSNFLRKALNISPAAIALLHETKTKFDDHGLKAVSINVQGHAGIERAISTAGGVDLGELTEFCEFKTQPLNYAVGEMLDWDAPTGGYLLQACFSTAVAAAKDLAKKLA